MFASFWKLLPKKLSQDYELEDWISKLNITIPEASFPLVGGMSMNLTNLTISKIGIPDLSATFDPESVGKENDIQLNVGLSAQLQSEMVFINLGKSYPGRVALNLSEGSVMLGLHFNKYSSGLIENVTIKSDQCSIDLSNVQKSDIVLEIYGNAFLSKMFASTFGSMIGKIGGMVCPLVSDLVATQVTSLFTDINSAVSEYKARVEPLTLLTKPNMVDLQTSSILDFLHYVLTNFTGINGPVNINYLMNLLTRNTGNLSVGDLIKNFGISMPLTFSIPISDIDMMINISLNELNITGLNTFTEFGFLKPISKVATDSNVGMETLGLLVDLSLNISANGEMISTGGDILNDHLNLALFMSQDTLDLLFQIASPHGASEDWTSPMCTEPDCLISLFSPVGTGITDLKVGASIDTLKIQTSSKNLNDFLNNIITFLLNGYRSVIPDILNGVVNVMYLSTMNDGISASLAKANCTYIKEPPYDDFNDAATIAANCAAVVIALILLLIVAIRQRDEKVLESFNADEGDGEGDSSSSSKEDCSTCWSNFWRTDEQASLLMCQQLPLAVRIIMPLLVMLNICCFISSNAGLGASVFPNLQIGGQEISFPSMFNLSLISSISDMWKASAYFLSVLITVMSCIWPYVKLCLMIIAWIFPASMISLSVRERLLRFLDALGKWSLVDTFVMAIFLVAFNISIEFPTISPKVALPVVVNLFVEPAYGFMTLMIGTICSLALSHVMLAIDRFVDRKTEDVDTEDNEFHPLFVYCPSNLAKVLVTIFLFVALVLVIVGMCLHSFSFSFVGLIGWAMEKFGYPHKKQYSIINLGQKMATSAENPNSSDIRFIQVIYYIIAICMPIIHITLLIVIWLVPMKKIMQRNMYHACEIIYAWSCLDVFIISILGALLELSQFATFMIGDTCDLIDPIVAAYFGKEPLIRGHESCFDAITKLESGFWILLVAVIFHTVTTIVVYINARKAIKNRASQAKVQQEMASEDEL